jgi:hypothetical protein
MNVWSVKTLVTLVKCKLEVFFCSGYSEFKPEKLVLNTFI